jgi:hypothetical protein
LARKKSATGELEAEIVSAWAGCITMRITLHAKVGRFEDDGFTLICGLSGTDPGGAGHYLNFQRGSEGGDPKEDRGVHIEFDDQSNGRYNHVKECRLSQDRLAVDLTGH